MTVTVAGNNGANSSERAPTTRRASSADDDCSTKRQPGQNRAACRHADRLEQRHAPSNAERWDSLRPTPQRSTASIRHKSDNHRDLQRGASDRLLQHPPGLTGLIQPSEPPGNPSIPTNWDCLAVRVRRHRCSLGCRGIGNLCQRALSTLSTMPMIRKCAHLLLADRRRGSPALTPRSCPRRWRLDRPRPACWVCVGCPERGADVPCRIVSRRQA